MHNNTRQDTTVAVIRSLMDALIEISVIADAAHKHAISETEYAGAFVPHSLAVMQYGADKALEDASKLLMADTQEVCP
ncbi:hypothetical protein FSI43_019170 [Escherichia coli]|uniref:hypothetical protein n=1 Tax=Escherichia coli TaxID=562 RepID=UPI000D15CD4D|nr:hypothetical protein [Escherichia coli]EFJ8857314.1 hypothetical protein [Escherichia coli]EFJ9345284.1 hypothetical protein [Escherichia coli]EFJ9375209.1 hypothetical protein [Escherichia coli]EFJ9400169.1 hypothetical protein [Escherichia coli]EFK0006668.1 hypothetical protein [Escherichia coli]